MRKSAKMQLHKCDNIIEHQHYIREFLEWKDQLFSYILEFCQLWKEFWWREIKYGVIDKL